MPHDTPLIATICAGIAIAFVLGAIAHRLRVSPLVGYLLAGVLVGPFTPGFVADQELANELAEIGVILLMFGVGLHFSLKDLLSVRAIAIPGAIAQMATATLLGLGLALLLGWGVTAGIVFGLALSVASTVVLLRAMQERRLIDTEKGKIAVGWLIVEDLAMVLALVLIPTFAQIVNSGTAMNAAQIGETLAITFGKVAAFVVVMLVVGRRAIPWLLHVIAHTGSRELFRLAVLAIALGVAFGSAKLFGVSFALGAFFAGMLLNESPLSHRAAQETLPLRDAFAVLFFVSVGMLFDPAILIRDPLPVLATVFIILVGKSVAAFLIVRAFGYTPSTALTISASLAQIGEFSFILAGLGVGLAILPERARDLILAGAIISIVANPLFFTALDLYRRRLDAAAEGKAAADTAAASEAAEEARREIEPVAMADHIVLVGYGRVGSFVGEELRRAGQSFLVVERNADIADALRKDGATVVSEPEDPADIVRAANVARARKLIVAIPETFEAGQLIEKARAVAPLLPILARAHSDAEIEYLTKVGATHVVMGERETARALVALVDLTRPPPPAAPSAAADATLETASPPPATLYAGAGDGAPRESHAADDGRPRHGPKDRGDIEQRDVGTEA